MRLASSRLLKPLLVLFQSPQVSYLFCCFVVAVIPGSEMNGREDPVPTQSR
jgi:hypothetical protein